MPHERDLAANFDHVYLTYLIPSIVERLPLPSTQTSFEFQVSSDVCFQVVICYCDYSFVTDVDDKDHETI